MTQDNFPPHLDPIEKRIVSKLLDSLLAQGCMVKIVSDGEVDVEFTQDRAEIEANIGTCDTTEILAVTTGKRWWLFLVHGNGEDVVSNCTFDAELDKIIEWSLADDLGA